MQCEATRVQIASHLLNSMGVFVPAYYQRYVLFESDAGMEQSGGKRWARFGAKSSCSSVLVNISSTGMWFGIYLFLKLGSEEALVTQTKKIKYENLLGLFQDLEDKQSHITWLFL